MENVAQNYSDNLKNVPYSEASNRQGSLTLFYDTKVKILPNTVKILTTASLISDLNKVHYNCELKTLIIVLKIFIYIYWKHVLLR